MVVRSWHLRLETSARPAARAAACALVLTMFGCASPDSRNTAEHPAALTAPDSPGAFVGNQGGAWEVLFSPIPDVTPVAAAETRRDASLNIREPESILMLGMWPEEPRPHLGHTRRLFLPRRADDVLFHGPRPPYHYRHHHRAWSWR